MRFPKITVPKYKYVFPAVVLIICVLIFGFAYLAKQTNSDNKPKIENYWMNCSNLNDFVESSDRLYLACSSGILIVNSSTGEVLRQLNTISGLPSDNVFSLLIKNNWLYVGHEKGLSIYDLNDFSKLGDYEMQPVLTMKVEDKRVYIGTISSVSVFNSTDLSFEDLPDFPVDATEELQVNHIYVVGGEVYVYLAQYLQPGELFQLSKDSSTWQKVAFKDEEKVFLLGLGMYENVLYAETSQGYWKTNFDSPLLELSKTESLPSNVDIISSKKTLPVQTLSKLNRPLSFDRLYFSIDENIIFGSYESGGYGIWSLNPKTREFTQLHFFADLDRNSEIYLLPILNSNRIFIFYQKCSNTCEMPEIGYLETPNYTYSKIDIKNLLPGLQDKLRFGLYKAEQQQIEFFALPSETLTEIYTLNLQNNEFTKGPFQDEQLMAEVGDPSFCAWSKNYKILENDFIESNVEGYCPKTAQDTLFNYKWTPIGGFLYKEDKFSNQITQLSVPSPTEMYTAIDEPGSFRVNALTKINDLVYVASSKGLAAYNTQDSSWNVYDKSDNLTDSAVVDFLPYDGKIFALSSSGFILLEMK